MSTTSLKLPDDLKQRAAAAAERAGLSPHAFMVGAIESATAVAEQRAQFLTDALAAREEMNRTGKGYDADEVHDYLRQRINDSATAKRPRSKSWSR